jgi:hypothetical protein
VDVQFASTLEGSAKLVRSMCIGYIALENQVDCSIFPAYQMARKKCIEQSVVSGWK